MERLSLHIISLLRLYDSVALPGVGIFNLRFISARLDRESSAYLPPRFEIDFQPNDKAQGFEELLASYIRREHVTPPAARKMLREDIEELTKTLEIKGEASLPGIGTIRILSGEMEFSENLAFNISLPIVHVSLPEISEQVVEEKTEEKTKKPEEQAVEPEEKEIAAEVIDSLPAEKISDNRDESHNKTLRSNRTFNPDYYYIPVHKKVAKIAACILLVVIVGLAAVIPLGSPSNSPSTAAITPMGVSENKIEKKESLKENKEEDTSLEIQNQEVATPDQEVSEPAVLKPESDRPAKDENDRIVPGAASLETKPYLSAEDGDAARYYAVIAAFRSQKEVEKYLDRKKDAKGKFTVLKKGKIFYLTVSSSNDKAELQSNLPLIRTDYPDAWIFAAK